MEDQPSIVAALQAGAIGYLTKDADAATIGEAIRAAAAGRSVMDGAVQANWWPRCRVQQFPDSSTTRATHGGRRIVVRLDFP